MKKYHFIKHKKPWYQSFIGVVIVIGVILGIRYLIFYDNTIFHTSDVESYANMFNEYRVQEGKEPLIFTDELNRISFLRVKEIEDDYSHNSIGGYNDRLGENIANAYNNEDALRDWKNSPGHNENMLKEEYKYTGYAILNGYAVQVFSEGEQ